VGLSPELVGLLQGRGDGLRVQWYTGTMSKRSGLTFDVLEHVLVAVLPLHVLLIRVVVLERVQPSRGNLSAASDTAKGRETNNVGIANTSTTPPPLLQLPPPPPTPPTTRSTTVSSHSSQSATSAASATTKPTPGRRHGIANTRTHKQQQKCSILVRGPWSGVHLAARVVVHALERLGHGLDAR